MATPNLGLPAMLSTDAQKELTFNDAMNVLDAIAPRTVISRTTTAPPATPADGNVYVVGVGATGVWAGKDSQIAYYAGGWFFLTPQEQWVVGVQDEKLQYAFSSGLWGKLVLQAQGFDYRKSWAPNTAYSAYDVLSYAGQTYEVPAAFTPGTVFDGTSLIIWAEKGADGTTSTDTGTGTTTGTTTTTTTVAAKAMFAYLKADFPSPTQQITITAFDTTAYDDIGFTQGSIPGTYVVPTGFTRARITSLSSPGGTYREIHHLKSPLLDASNPQSNLWNFMPQGAGGVVMSAPYQRQSAPTLVSAWIPVVAGDTLCVAVYHDNGAAVISFPTFAAWSSSWIMIELT